MALLATPVAPHLGGTTFGNFGAAAIAAGIHGAFSVLPLLSAFSFAAVCTFSASPAAAAFPPATTAAAATSVHSLASMASVGPSLPVSRKSVVPLSNSLDDVIAADTVTRCQVPCLHLVLGRQGVDEDGVQHVVVECQTCCTHLSGKILDPTHLF